MKPIGVMEYKGSLKSDGVDWYDYEKMTGFIFPLAGEKVQFARLSHPWTDGEVIGMNSKGECVVEHADGFCSVHLEEDLRPMDWDKSNEEKNLSFMIEVIIMQSFDSVSDTARAIAATILAAGYRKCDNKTPSTKE